MKGPRPLTADNVKERQYGQDRNQKGSEEAREESREEGSCQESRKEEVALPELRCPVRGAAHRQRRSNQFRPAFFVAGQIITLSRNPLGGAGVPHYRAGDDA